MNVIAQFLSEEDARECERLCRLYIATIFEDDMRVSLAPASRFPWNVAADVTGKPSPRMQRIVAFVHGYACGVGREGSFLPSIMCKGDLRDEETER